MTDPNVIELLTKIESGIDDISLLILIVFGLMLISFNRKWENRENINFWGKNEETYKKEINYKLYNYRFSYSFWLYYWLYKRGTYFRLYNF